MSSPTYDQQVDLSQDDIEAFDQIEHGLSWFNSQSGSLLSSKRQRLPSSPLKRVSLGASATGKEKRQREIAEALRGAPRSRSGKENLDAAVDERPMSSSPSNDLAFSSQSDFNVALHNNSENPFNILNTSLSPLLSVSFHVSKLISPCNAHRCGWQSQNISLLPTCLRLIRLGLGEGVGCTKPLCRLYTILPAGIAATLSIPLHSTRNRLLGMVCSHSRCDSPTCRKYVCPSFCITIASITGYWSIWICFCFACRYCHPYR